MMQAVTRRLEKLEAGRPDPAVKPLRSILCSEDYMTEYDTRAAALKAQGFAVRRIILAGPAPEEVELQRRRWSAASIPAVEVTR